MRLDKLRFFCLPGVTSKTVGHHAIHFNLFSSQEHQVYVAALCEDRIENGVPLIQIWMGMLAVLDVKSELLVVHGSCYNTMAL